MSAVRPTLASVYTLHNRAALLQGGRPYFERLLQLLDGAQHSIHLQFYIFEADETGQSVALALKRAALRGVEVYVLLDGYASQSLPQAFIDDLKTAGIRHRWFEPVLRGKSYYFGRRLHHKVVVADGEQALVGGINISNRYNDMPGQPAWLDWAVWVEGEAALQLDTVCARLWNKSAFGFRKLAKPAIAAKQIGVKEECYVRVRRNDWVNRRIEISRSYLEMLRRAEQEIIIMSSYFLPGRLIRTALQGALRRGVRIRLIIAGSSDVKLAKAAERYWYPWLLRQGIQIYEYQPRILHGKMSVYDRKWVTVGSYNVNNISAYASLELNLDILDTTFGGEARNRLQKIIETDCIEVTAERFERSKGILASLFYWSSYEFYRIVVFLFTFYFRQKKRE